MMLKTSEVGVLNNAPYLNLEIISKLQKSTQDNPALLIDIFVSFINDCEELIGAISHSLNHNNPEAYYNAVHTLKGLSGTIGCSKMFELLKMMDSLNKSQDFENSKAYIQPLKDIFSETKQTIDHQVLKTGSGH